MKAMRQRLEEQRYELERMQREQAEREEQLLRQGKQEEFDRWNERGR